MIILVGNDTLFASANISFLAPGKEYFLAVCKFLRTKREYCKVFGRGKLGYTIFLFLCYDVEPNKIQTPR
jgi:hypothetical protein